MSNNYHLVVYPSAIKDIDNICHYIAVELSNPIAANEFIEELEQAFNRVIAFPKMYQLIDNQFVNDTEIRRVLVKNYAVFYKIVSKEIQVIRILHTKSDYSSFLV